MFEIIELMNTSQISDEAVEAAARETYRVAAEFAYESDSWDDLSDGQREAFTDDARKILEAAAPHMQRTISTVEELDALPVGSIVRVDENYSLYVKDSIRITRSWWVTVNEQFDFETKDIELPVTVLHVGGAL